LSEAARLYGVSEDTLYRALRERFRPRSVRRADRGQPRVIPREELERYCEIIAALKLRTSNGKGRHLSTREAIRLLECYGVDTPEGRVQAPPTLLNKTTINRYLGIFAYPPSSHAWHEGARTKLLADSLVKPLPSASFCHH
jgi:hypothetical protein